MCTGPCKIGRQTERDFSREGLRKVRQIEASACVTEIAGHEGMFLLLECLGYIVGYGPSTQQYRVIVKKNQGP
jgi:hypothetical protein